MRVDKFDDDSIHRIRQVSPEVFTQQWRDTAALRGHMTPGGLRPPQRRISRKF